MISLNLSRLSPGMVAFRGAIPPAPIPPAPWGRDAREEVYQTRVVVGPVVPVRFSPVVLKPALNTRIFSFNAGVPMPERPLHVKSWPQPLHLRAPLTSRFGQPSAQGVRRICCKSSHPSHLQRTATRSPFETWPLCRNLISVRLASTSLITLSGHCIDLEFQKLLYRYQ